MIVVLRGTADEYQVLHEVVDRFPLPLHLVAGNHDDPATLLAEFGGTRFLGETTHYRAGPLVVLDSATGQPGAGPTRVARPHACHHRPGTVCLHHPPVPIGIPFLDRQCLADGERPADIIRRHDVTHVLAGHVHRHVTAPFAGTILTTAPSTHLHSGLVLNDTIPDYLDEPTSFLLHLGHVTHTVPVSHAAGTVSCY